MRVAVAMHVIVMSNPVIERMSRRIGLSMTLLVRVCVAGIVRMLVHARHYSTRSPSRDAASGAA
jgi:hypothetical protein